MRRLAILAALAVGAAPLLVASPAGAVSAVGGGAAGIEVGTVIRQPLLSLFTPFLPPDTFEVDVNAVYPSVVLPYPNGSAKQIAGGVGETVGPVTVGAMRVTTVGTPAGNPYAESSASVLSVSIPGADIRAVSTHCRWDTTGAVMSTDIVRLNGTMVQPAPNTVVPLPGLGRLVLNEQIRQWDNLVAVTGADLFLDQSSMLGTTEDISIAFSSCDPNILPIIGGIRLLSGS